MQVNLYVLALLATGGVSILLAISIVRQRRLPGNSELALLLAAVGEWALTLTPEAAATTIAPKLFWSAVAYVGTTTAPVFLFLYALRRAQLDHWLTPRRTAALFVLPLVTTLMAATNGWHHLLWSQVTLTTTWASVSAQYGRGPWFWVNVAYSYLLVSSGVLLLVWAVMRLPHLYSLQARILFLASLVPLAGNALYLSNPRAVAGVDPTPVAFMCTGLFLTLGIRRYRLLDLVPLARETLFENLRDGVLFFDAQGQLIDLNPAAQQMLGLTPEAIGQPAATALARWPELAALCQANAERHAEVSLHADPDEAIEVHLSPLRSPGRPAAGSMAVLRDISERRRAEKERLALERRLLHAHKLESLGTLAGGIAHDFNNLLTSILGNLEFVGHHLPAASPAQASIEDATQSAQRAATLTKQLLAYAGKGAFVVRPVDLSDVITAMGPLLRATVPSAIRLSLRLASTPPPIMADPAQIEQVAMNLVTNAVEAIGDATGTVTLATGVRAYADVELQQSRIEEKPGAGRFVYLEVTDTGCGMGEETLRHLFEPFFTTKFQGRGLGMAAVLGIVRAHGGAILVESREGAGSAIRVLFSAAEPCEQPVAPTAP